MTKLSQYREQTLKVRDKFTGFTGTVTGHADYITGCDQYLVQPEVGENNTWSDSRWLDENRLEVVGESESLISKGTGINDKGADIPAPIK